MYALGVLKEREPPPCWLGWVFDEEEDHALLLSLESLHG